MSKPVKDMMTSELRGRYSDTSSALWVEMLGIDGVTTTEFRRDLNRRQMRLEVVKNALFRRAVSGGPLGRLADSLSGPAVIVTGGESLIDVAKAVDEWIPRLKGLRLRGAVFEGEYIDESRVKQVKDMPTRADLQARIAGMALAPGGNLSAAILSGGARIASCIKSLIQKLEDGSPPASAA